ncbi:M16 family metallopeptidase [Flavilitoribacter nigricans]|uniref:Peptidase M16 n=1 Tax=Flavilitoribacter nigricans (strain ATCC 23147 / DSM 23189 / NBRC 102662 / NCIMB 1420 / SS-2) TaxID=1122177 RepID=A0A2D0N5L2_FLAN2|nr:pitrilysin family protein [Flavilitoribacter nigricans]PHN03063.1 peptidase M16 [Flavilitoribacter nigricans DSM 23189 = NBRC 102662]
MPDRSHPPLIHNIGQLILPLPELIHLDNGIPVYVTNMGTQDVIRLEIVYRAGRPFEQKQLASRATAAMLKEGTRQHDAAAIAETIDFYGASLSQPFNLDTGNLVLYSLSRHFESVLPLFTEMLDSPVFPEDELRAFVKRNKKSLKTDLAKTDVVAYRTVTEKVFGEDHPYGYNSTLETYEELGREDLVAHFERCYGIDNCTVFLSGRITDSVIRALNAQIGQLERTGRPESCSMAVHAPARGYNYIPHPDSVQTAIRIGRRVFSRHHPDYPAFFVLNTILGGYFGSRLMTNIREDKGYTYNIYSSLDVMRNDGAFYIGTEVGNEFVEDTLHQIRLELKSLIEHPVEEEELTMVRNYLMGNFLSMLDGPFNVGEVVRTMVGDDLPFSFFSTLVESVNTVEAETLQRLAVEYLQPEEQWEVIVGTRQGS